MSAGYCVRGGRVVGTRWPIPGAAFDRDFGGPTLGCNHLRCSACGNDVRQAAGLSWGATADQLHASPDWNALAEAGVVERDADHRLYACACRMHVEEYDRTLIDGDDWDHDEPPPPWRCAGHPAVTLPTVLDGVALDGDSDVLEQIVAAASGGPAAAPGFTRQYPSAWMHRVVHLVAPRPAGLAAALGAALAHPDAAVRAAVTDLYRRTPTLVGGEAVADALLGAPEQWFGIANPLAAGETLDQWAQIAVARRALWVDPLGSALDESARAALYRIAVMPHPPALSLLAALAELDPTWLATHAGDVLAGSPTHEVARDVLYALRRDGQRAVDAAVAMAWVYPGAADAYHGLVAELAPGALEQLG